MSKIRIKMGAVEVEYEGTDDFLRDELPLLLDKLAALGARVPATNPDLGAQGSIQESGLRANGGSAGTLDLGTCSNVAAILSVKSGPDLVIAAAARLIIGDGRSSITRKEILEEMKSATAYYNKNIGSNLSTTITGLVKAKKLKEVAKDTYGLAADTINELRSRLAS